VWLQDREIKEQIIRRALTEDDRIYLGITAPPLNPFSHFLCLGYYRNKDQEEK
jgi:hypothetical protein